DRASGIAVEEQVRMSLQPVSLPAVDREPLDSRVRARHLSHWVETGIDIPAELGQEQTNASLPRCGQPRARIVNERHLITDRLTVKIDFVRRGDLGNSGRQDAVRDSGRCLSKGDPLA